jgi:SNF2 family DNA or RNA helicase
VKHKLWEPHFYQQNAVEFTLANFERERCSALFLQPGLGKTSITLEVFRRLKESQKAKKMLVIAPLRVAQSTWPSEMYRWLNFSGMTYAVLHGPNKDREALRDVDVYIINYEGIPWLFSKSKFWLCDMLVMDELTRLKSWTAQRVKVLKPFLATFKYRLGLTGTPAPNGLQDLFSQIYMLDLGKRFGHRITKFMDRYFKPPSLYSYKREIQPWAADQIHEKLKDLAFSLDANDWLKLPTEIHNVIHLEFPESLKAKYNELKKEFILQLETAVITAHSASVLSTKLRQYLSGSVYVDGIPHPAHSIKYDYLKEFVEDLEGPLLVAYQYRHEVARLKALFPHAIVIDNTVKADQLNTIIRDWNAGKIQMLIGHPQSVGHGLNLQAGGNNILFFSLDYNLETYQQFIKRVSRQGQKESHVFIHYLVFQGTLDEHVLATLQGKDEVQKTLLDFLNEEN